MIFMLSIGIMNHVIVIPLLLDTAGRDSWLSVLLAGLLYIIFILSLFFIHKRTRNKNILQWIRNFVSPWPARILVVLIIFYLLCINFISMKDTMTWINLSFLPDVPLIVITVTFIFICCANAFFGLRSIAIVSGILLPFVVLLGFFVMSVNFRHKDHAYLLPLLENGIEPALNGILYVAVGLVEIFLLLFIQHYISSTIRFIPLLLLGLSMIGLTIGPLIGAIAEFGPFHAKIIRYPAYEEWRLVTIGGYIEHVDFFSIYQWFSGAYIRVSLTLFLILDLLGIKKSKNKIYYFGILIVLITGLVVYPLSDIIFYSLLHKYLPYLLGFALFIFFSIFILVLAGDRKRRQRK